MKVKKVLLIYFISFVLISAGIGAVIYLDWYTQINVTVVEDPPKYKETLTAVADFDYRPFSFIDSDGKVAGFDIDLMKAISQKIHKTIDVCLMTWTKASEALSGGGADIILGMEYSPEEYPGFDFCVPIGNDSFVFFGKKELKNFGQLYSSKIAIIRDAGQAQTYLEAYDLGDNLVFFPSYTEMFLAIADGSCDFAFCRYTVGRLRAAGIDSSIKQASSAVLSVALSSAVKAGNQKLHDELNAAIIALAKDGTLDAIADKWMNSYVKFSNISDVVEEYSTLIICIASFAVLLLLIIIIYYTTRSYNEQNKKTVQIKKEEKDVFLELYNRKGIEQRMKEVFRADSGSSVHAVFVININNFKKINDKFGYEKGNDVLKNIGQLLRMSFREKDCTGRLNADEFVVLMTDARDENTIMSKAERLYKAIADFYNFTEMEGTVYASIGIAIFPQDGTTADALIKNASKALGVAKRKNKDKGGCALYGSDMAATE